MVPYKSIKSSKREALGQLASLLQTTLCKDAKDVSMIAWRALPSSQESLRHRDSRREICRQQEMRSSGDRSENAEGQWSEARGGGGGGGEGQEAWPSWPQG